MPTKTPFEYDASAWLPGEQPFELIADSLELAELELAQSLALLHLMDETADPYSEAQVSVKGIRALCQVLLQSLNSLNDSVTHIRNVTTRLQEQKVKT